MQSACYGLKMTINKTYKPKNVFFCIRIIKTSTSVTGNYRIRQNAIANALATKTKSNYAEIELNKQKGAMCMP